MSEFPEGAYLTVRALPEGWWSAVVAVQGHVITKASFQDREQAFRAAIGKAQKEGLPCLVRRVAA